MLDSGLIRGSGLALLSGRKVNVTLEQISEAIPAYAKDLRLNLSSVFNQAELTPQQAWGTGVSTALASGNPQLYKAIVTEAEKHLSKEALEGAKGAAAIMGMNNIFYRFQHLAENDKYSNIPARLRMNIMRTHGADPVDFELWSTAVSAVNGCGKCIVAHEKTLVDKGVPAETIAAAVRIGSVLHAIAAVLDIEQA
jgi:lipoyl-dependent peroxiredoxin subunit D